MAQQLRFRTILQRILLLVILLSAGFTAFANEEENGGTIKGTVTTSDNKPAAAVSVVLKGTKKGARTNDDGTFQIRNVAPGTYTVEVSLVGYETVSETVTVAQKETVTVQLQLNVSEKSLSEVVVTGAYSRFTPSNSEYVAKLPLKNIENPQVYSVVGAEMIKEQVITSYDDALKNAAGLSKLWSSTGRGGDGAGYYSLRGFAVQPTLVNGLAGLTASGLDVANVERIEVIKGPSGTLFGSTLVSYGGLINTVTKRPYDDFGGSVSFTSGTYGLNRFTADVNTPLDKDHKVLLRMVGAYHDENSFQDAGFKKNRFFAPSLTYKASDKLTFMVNAEFLSAEGTNPTMLFLDRGNPLKAKNLEELGYNKKNAFTSNDLSIKNPTTTLQAQMQYKLSDQWTSQTILSRSTAKSQGYYSYLYETATTMPDVPSTFARYVSDQNYTTTATDIQQNFMGDFKLGSMRNRVVIGVDYLKQEAHDNSTDYVLNGLVDMTGFDSGILSRQHMDSLLQGAGISNSNLSQEVISGYISDVFNFLPQLSAMAGLRVDHFRTGGLSITEDAKYNQTTLSPKFGLVYQPVLNVVSLFANYMNGFTNTAPRPQSDNTIKTFEPEHANQWEVGVKTNLVADILTATVSYYDIKVSNTIMQGAVAGLYTQGGKQYSRGIDADIVANPISGLNIVAGYSYNESKVTETDAHDYQDRRPEGAGPRHQANAWISYKCPAGKLEGFGAGFGGNYGGENMILNRETTGVFTLPSYTVLNAALFYNTGKFNITLKLDNLTNKEYYKGWSTIEPQMPRRFSASGTFKF